MSEQLVQQKLAEVDALRKNIKTLYGFLGAAQGACRACGKVIFWVRSRNGKMGPFTESGLNHFVDCLHANQFRKNEKLQGDQQ